MLYLLWSIGSALQGQTLTLPTNTFQIDPQQHLILVNCSNTLRQQNPTQPKTQIVADAAYQLTIPTNTFQNGQVVSATHATNGQRYDIHFTSLPIVAISTSQTIAAEPRIPAQWTMIDSNHHFPLSFPKKSFRIEFWTDQTGQDTQNKALLGMRSDDDWNLQALYNEPLRCRSLVANMVWRDWHQTHYIDQEPQAVNGIQMKYVEVFVNGTYRGVYALSERIDRKQLRLKKYNNGFKGLLYKAIDWGNGPVLFDSMATLDPQINYWSGYEQKYPDALNWQPLHDLVDFVVNSSDATFYSDYPNRVVTSNKIDYFLFLNFIRAWDNRGKNTFMARYDANSPFFYAPWDLDNVWGTLYNGLFDTQYIHLLSNGLYDRLQGDCATRGFSEQMITRWNQLRQSFATTNYVMGLLQHHCNYLTNNNVYTRESLAWGYTFPNDQLTLTRTWIDQRTQYLDSMFTRPCRSISVQQTTVAAFDVQVYPNPVVQDLHVVYQHHTPALARLYSRSGQLVHQFELASGSNFQSVRDLPSGVYLLQVQAGAQHQTLLVQVE